MWHVALTGHWVPLALVALATLVVADAGLVVVNERPGGVLNPYPVKVSEVQWALYGTVLANTSGFGQEPGHDVVLTLSVVNNCLFCGTINLTAATTNTSGFTVVSFDLPPIPYGTTGDLEVTVLTPSDHYSGALEIGLE